MSGETAGTVPVAFDEASVDAFFDAALERLRGRIFSTDQDALKSPHLPASVVTLAEVERWFIVTTLLALNGNKTKAAARLGIDRRTLYRKLAAYRSEDAVRSAGGPT